MHTRSSFQLEPKRRRERKNKEKRGWQTYMSCTQMATFNLSTYQIVYFHKSLYRLPAQVKCATCIHCKYRAWGWLGWCWGCLVRSWHWVFAVRFLWTSCVSWGTGATSAMGLIGAGNITPSNFRYPLCSKKKKVYIANIWMDHCIFIVYLKDPP